MDGAVAEPNHADNPAFWPYLQPIGLYNILSARQGNILVRNLSYAKRKESSSAAVGGEVSVQLTGCIATPAPGSRPISSVSVIVAVCERLSNGTDYKPLSARLAVWNGQGRTSGAEAAASTSSATANQPPPPITLPLPQSESLNLHILLLVWEGVPDVHQLLCKRHGAHLSVDLSREQVLGVIPKLDAVWSAAVQTPANGLAARGGQAAKSTAGKDTEGKAGMDMDREEKGKYEVRKESGGNASGSGRKADALQVHTSLARCTAAVQLYKVKVQSLPESDERTVHTLKLTPLGAQLVGTGSSPKLVARGSKASGSTEDEAGGSTSSLCKPAILQSVTLSCKVTFGSRPLPAAAATALASKRGREEAGAGRPDDSRAAAGQADGTQPPGPSPKKARMRRVGAAQTKLSAGDRMLQSCSSVKFRYMYAEDRLHVEEPMEDCRCAFCYVSCDNALGLKHHLLASHEHLHYEFIVSATTNGVHAGGTMSQAGADALKSMSGEHAGLVTVLVRVPGRLYKAAGPMVVPAGDTVVMPDSGQTYRLLWFYHRRSHPTRICITNAPLASNSVAAKTSHMGGGRALMESLVELPESIGGLPVAGATVGASGEDGTEAGAGAMSGRVTSGAGAGTIRAAGTAGVRGAGTHNARGAALAAAITGAAKRRKGGAAARGPPTITFGYGHASLSDDLYGPDFKEERYYFHARTSVPMAPGDLGEDRVDSDDETDSDEFESKVLRDLHLAKNLTAPERALMTSWKRFERTHPLTADYLIPSRCEAFVSEQREELQAAGPAARDALVVHLLLLWEFALVDGTCMDRCLRIYDGEEVPNLPKPGPRDERMKGDVEGSVGPLGVAGAGTSAGTHA